MSEITIEEYNKSVGTLQLLLQDLVEVALRVLSTRSVLDIKYDDKTSNILDGESYIDTQAANSQERGQNYRKTQEMAATQAAQIDLLDNSDWSNELRKRFEATCRDMLASYDGTRQIVASGMLLKTSFKDNLPGYTLAIATAKWANQPDENRKNFVQKFSPEIRADLRLEIAANILKHAKDNLQLQNQVYVCVHDLSDIQDAITMHTPDGPQTAPAAELVREVFEQNGMDFPPPASAAGSAAEGDTITEAGLWDGHGSPAATTWDCVDQGIPLNASSRITDLQI